MIRCYTELVGNLSKGFFEQPTLTGRAHFTFLSSGSVQIFSEIVSTIVKKLSNTHFIASRHIKLKGKVFISGWLGRSCDRLPQKICRNSNENPIFNTLHKVYLWQKKKNNNIFQLRIIFSTNFELKWFWWSIVLPPANNAMKCIIYEIYLRVRNSDLSFWLHDLRIRTIHLFRVH